MVKQYLTYQVFLFWIFNFQLSDWHYCPLLYLLDLLDDRAEKPHLKTRNSTTQFLMSMSIVRIGSE